MRRRGRQGPCRVSLHYFVLRPDQPTTLLRGVSRKAPGALIDPQVIRHVWQQFAALGDYERHALGTTQQTPAETVTLVRRAIATGLQRLGS